MRHLKIFVFPHIQIFFFTSFLLLFAGATVCVNAKIVYCVDGDIYVMNDDGTYRRCLTHNPLWKDTYPRWSPDGKKITFIRQMDKKRQASSELFVMNADGKHLQRLTHDDVSDAYPSWSPDGKRIAFRSQRSGRSEVHVIDMETLVVTQLTGLKGEKGSTAPDWSPDGTQIVYEKFINNPVRRPGSASGFAHKNIYVMAADGENQRPLLPNPKVGADTVIMRFFPSWSADGQRLVFMDCTWKGKEQKCRLSMMRIGGSIQVIQDVHDKLGNNALTAGVRWIENDRALLFTLKKIDTPNANTYDLYKYEFETGSIKRLTWMLKDVKYPDWIKGPLPVSPQGNLPKQWDEKKQTLSQ